MQTTFFFLGYFRFEEARIEIGVGGSIESGTLELHIVGLMATFRGGKLRELPRGRGWNPLKGQDLPRHLSLNYYKGFDAPFQNLAPYQCNTAYHNQREETGAKPRIQWYSASRL